MTLHIAKSNIAVMGLRGVGKTSVARELACALRRDVVDTDKLIEAGVGKSTADILKQDGEVAFRFHEIAAVAQASEMSDMIISCGGGVVDNRINILMLSVTSNIVLLRADVPTMVRRIEEDTENERPLLVGSNRTEEVEAMIKRRGKLHSEAADFEVDTTHMTVQEVVEYIAGRI